MATLPTRLADVPSCVEFSFYPKEPRP